MQFNPRLVTSAAAIAVTCALSAAAYYYKSRRSEINEVMVFCKLQYNAYNYFDKLMSYIEKAKQSVHVCMPGIHNIAIQGRLVEIIKQKNIKAKIVMDQSGYNAFTETFINELIDAGAEVKCKPYERFNKMQHKFCLVDDKILMTGTLNWGDDRSSDNWNYVYVTNKNQLVEPVKREFNQMWSAFPKDLKLHVQESLNESVADTEDVNTPLDTDDDVAKDLNFECLAAPQLVIY